MKRPLSVLEGIYKCSMILLDPEASEASKTEPEPKC